jgi:hypothetical protein
MTQNKLQKRRAMAEVKVVEELLRRWDPIGTRPGEYGPSDEYDGYAPHIVSLVRQGSSQANLTKHLEYLRTVTIGVGADRQCDEQIAKEIIQKLRASTA